MWLGLSVTPVGPSIPVHYLSNSHCLNSDLYKFHMAVFMFKNKDRGNFRINHGLNTRNSGLARPTYQRLTVTQQAVSFQAPRIWNELPLEIRSLNSLIQFKKQLKSYFIQHYWKKPLIRLTFFYLLTLNKTKSKNLKHPFGAVPKLNRVYAWKT